MIVLSPEMIDDLFIWDKLEIVLLRVFHVSSLPEGTIVKDTYVSELDWYEQFTVNEPYTKPDKQEILDEFEEYKDEQRANFEHHVNEIRGKVGSSIWEKTAEAFSLDTNKLFNEVKTGAHIDAFNFALKKYYIRIAHTEMNEDIYAEMYSLFQTTDPISAHAFAQSWGLKKDNPAEYLPDNLVATHTVGVFTMGDMLDTEQKIVDFYTEMTKLLVQFDKFRDNRIKQYLQEKAEIEAS